MANLEIGDKSVSNTELGSVTPEQLDKKIGDVHYILVAVVAVLGVSVITMILMVGSMINDSYRFNTVVYREYAAEYRMSNQLYEVNSLLLNENKEILKVLQTSTSTESN